MKNSYLLYLFSFSLIFLLLNIAVSAEIDNVLIEQIEENTYDFSLWFNFNDTYYYTYLTHQVLEFNIECSDWGNDINSGYHGLVIEIIFDNNSSKLNSWLISSGDISEHHFTSENELSGIFKLHFYIINVNKVDFSLKLDGNLPIWSYEDLLDLNSERIFFIERNAQYYNKLYTIAFLLDINFIEPINYTLCVLDRYNNDIMVFQGNFTAHEKEILEFVIENGLNFNVIYKIRFELDNSTLFNHVRFEFFYDKVKFTNIGRSFLSIGNYEIEELPLDKDHADSNFLWIIEEPYETYTPPPPPPPRFTIEALLISLFIIVSVILLTVAWVMKGRNRRTNQPQSSNKYKLLENPPVKYSPPQAYAIDFDQASTNYNLSTNEASKVSCSICMQIITDRNRIIRCPSCDVAYHNHHLYQWIVDKGTCPICRAKLRISKL